jgi:catechol 2,3-dioxygenase-like lactoylglutathione lyase family enzyme
MQIANKLMMCSINVADMAKSKNFYITKLGFEIATEYRQDDDNWWTTLALPEGGTTLTLSRASVSPESIKAGTLSMYFEVSDVEAAHKEATGKDIETDGVQDDLFGPGSGVKWFSTKDPDGNQVMFAEKHDARAPF